MQIVWFKRDLRIQDHAPLSVALTEARTVGAVLPMYIHEPSWLTQPDTAGQHVAFARECQAGLAADLREVGGVLFEPVGEAVAVLESVWRQAPFTRLLSYQETNTAHTFARDRDVKAWCRERGVSWVEFSQNGVQRGSEFWKRGFKFGRHLEEQLKTMWTLPKKRIWAAPPWEDGLVAPVKTDKPGRQKGGRAQAWALLEDFLSPAKLYAYPKAISSPNTAVDGCSRLSPYLAFGVLSDGEVFRALYERREALRAVVNEDKSAALDQAVKFFIERLYWRAAYHQSFEMDFEREHITELSQFDGQRESVFIPEWLEAWKTGRTGVPYVDAAMRMLARTGWINMRLRGTVASFALNELWLPWRDVGLHLAREFLDYDAPIHWSQIQIHAGTAKMCDPLTYDPRKQARDHDPDGTFVREWVPELANVPLEYLVEPWTMPPHVQAQAGCLIGVTYPAPPVNLAQANDAAKERVAALRKGKNPPRNSFWSTRDKARIELVQGGLF